MNELIDSIRYDLQWKEFFITAWMYLKRLFQVMVVVPASIVFLLAALLNNFSLEAITHSVLQQISVHGAGVNNQLRYTECSEYANDPAPPRGLPIPFQRCVRYVDHLVDVNTVSAQINPIVYYFYFWGCTIALSAGFLWWKSSPYSLRRKMFQAIIWLWRIYFPSKHDSPRPP